MADQYRSAPQGYRWIYVAWITNHVTKRRIYARQYGKRAFRILVKE